MFHQALDGAARDRDALSPHLLVDLIGTVDPHIGLPDPLDLRLGGIVCLGACTPQIRVALLGRMTPVARPRGQGDAGR